MESKITRAGQKNVVVFCHGKAPDENESLIVISPSDVHCGQLKLDQIQFSLEKDLRAYVGWSEDGIFLPLDGKGLLNYYGFDSLQPTSQGQHLFLKFKGDGYFHIVFDMTKQG